MTRCTQQFHAFHKHLDICNGIPKRGAQQTFAGSSNSWSHPNKGGNIFKKVNSTHDECQFRVDALKLPVNIHNTSCNLFSASHRLNGLAARHSHYSWSDSNPTRCRTSDNIIVFFSTLVFPHPWLVLVAFGHSWIWPWFDPACSRHTPVRKTKIEQSVLDTRMCVPKSQRFFILEMRWIASIMPLSNSLNFTIAPNNIFADNKDLILVTVHLVRRIICVSQWLAKEPRANRRQTKNKHSQEVAVPKDHWHGTSLAHNVLS